MVLLRFQTFNKPLRLVSFTFTEVMHALWWLMDAVKDSKTEYGRGTNSGMDSAH
jgi:hypothetical protein